MIQTRQTPRFFSHVSPACGAELLSTDAFLEKQSEITWVHRHELDELLQEVYLANLELERYR